MLNDDKLASEGYHELMDNFNIQFIKKSGEISYGGDSSSAVNYNSQVGFIAKTPLLIAAVKCIDLATGHQDPTCQLIDNTGTICGQLSSEIIEQYGSRIQPGTVLVLRNMAVLSTVRNVYVNITLSNMIALFWLSPSNENGLSKSSGIFGKRICRVTKADILRDAKLIEDETIAEVQAQQAYIHPEIMPNRFPTPSGKLISPSSSSSSIPSSIRAPIYNSYYSNRNDGNQNYQLRQPVPPIRQNFVPGITSSPSNINWNTNWSSNSEAHFRGPSPVLRQPNPYERVLKPSTVLPNCSGAVSPFNSKLVNSNTRQIFDSHPTNLTIQQTNTFQSKYNFQHSLNTAANNQKENSITSERNTNIIRQISDSSSSNLLEGVDEDSLFGDF